MKLTEHIVKATLRALRHAMREGGDGMCRVGHRQVKASLRKVYLVNELFVLISMRQALQTLYDSLRIALSLDL